MQVPLSRSVTSWALSLACLLQFATAQSTGPDLTQLNLEDLMNLQVTSVSKKEQKISQTPSAVFVITSEDIRRSGATNIPDVLRMAPGVEVAQINSNKWAISVRGFNGQYSNKLLILMDGRTVYNPMFSGVFWDAQYVPLDSVERIEVVRGPGATVWGANAVNGVINIITRKANETQGGLVTAGGGTYEQGFGSARYGGRVGSHLAYRVFAAGFNRSSFPGPTGQDGEDEWNMVRGGFRVDASVSPLDSITIQGDTHRGNAGETAQSIVSIFPPVNGVLALHDRYSGWNLLSRWNHVASPRSETSLQVYFDRTTRGDTTYGFGVNTFDLDFQHHVGWGSRQDLVWGLGYRLNSDSTFSTSRVVFSPASRTTQLFSAFVQDEIAIRPDRVYLSLGTKLERNDYSGFGWQPSARLAWMPSNHNMLWAAVSSALQTPSRLATGFRINWAVLPGPNGLPLMISLFSRPGQKNEHLIACEAGYRASWWDRLSFDSAIFFNNYDHVASVEPGAPDLETDPQPAHLVLPTAMANLLRAETHGLEVFANWKVMSRWTLRPGYSFLTTHIHRNPTSLDLTDPALVEGGNPNHQAQLRSHVTLPRHWEWNASAYFVGRLPALAVPAYTRVDTNIVWQPLERFSISLIGQNLLKDRHLEYGGFDTSVLASLAKRSAYAKFSWWF